MGDSFFQFITHVLVDAAIELSKLEAKLGPFKLTLLQFLNKVSLAFGSDIRTHFRDNDLYSLLLDVYETYPLHDMAL
jgi:hypothetical protein